MKFTKKTIIVFAAAAMLMTSSVHAQNWSWDGGAADDKYESGDNWTALTAGFPDNTVPTTQGNNTLWAAVDGAFPIDFDALSNVQTLDLLNLSNGAVVNMTGGAFTKSRAGNTVRDSYGVSGTGEFNQSGGDHSVGHVIRLGFNNSNAQGTYNLSGGSLVVFRGGNQLVGSGASPSIAILSPTTSTNGPSSFNVSGGTLETRFGVEIDASSAFNVIGDAGSITLGGAAGNASDGFWFQAGTLGFDIGANNNVTPIFVADLNPDVPGELPGQFVTFLAGSALDLRFSGTPTGGTWTLLELENGDINDEGLALSAATDSNWSFAVDNSGTNGLLTATYVGSGSILLGDANCNGVVDFLDIVPFIALISSGDFKAEADVDGSTAVDFLDIVPFIAILSGS